MRLLYSAKKVETTTFDFFSLPYHPKALLVKVRGDKVDDYAFITPRATVERLRAVHMTPCDGVAKYRDLGKEPIVKFYTERGDGYASLPPNARYWLVPREALTVEEINKDLFDYGQELLDHVEDPDWVPIYKSGYDHQVWDIDEKPILMPIAVELWGTRFDLEAVKKHLEALKHPGVVSFTIEPNTCVPNWSISGRNKGRLVLDTAKLGIDFNSAACCGTPRANRSWLQDYVVNCYEDVTHDVLGLQAFKRSEEGQRRLQQEDDHDDY